MSDRPASPRAFLDVGTQTILQLVAERGEDGGLRVLDDACVTVGLGRGLEEGGELDPAAVTRALEALDQLTRRAIGLGVAPGDITGVGTAVLRRARDGAAFAERVRRRLGVAFEMIDGAEEARLGHLAVSSSYGAQAVVIDTGGGSTEVVGEGGALCATAPVGALVLTDRHRGDLAAIDAEVVAAVEAFPAGLAGGAPVILLGGSASNLACLELRLPAFDPSAVEGVEVDTGSVGRWARTLAAEPLDARRRRPVEADRAAILPAGLVCLHRALERIGADRARVSARGLRYGLAAEGLGLVR